MKLNRVILSSNDNPKYLDLWPYVAKAWREIIGIEPVLFFIGPHSKVIELSKYGQVIQVYPHPDLDIVNQSQSIRLWASTKFVEENLIISDMDMLPISKQYFLDSIKDFPDNSIISYTSDVMKYGFYLRSPQLPMCYLAGKGETFNDILGISKNTSWEFFIDTLVKERMGYGTDQRFFYKQLLKWGPKSDRYIGLERGWIGGKVAVKRLDKVTWPTSDYNAKDYYDCHLPIPLSENQEKCLELFKKLDLI
jgi:hypothetical protein